MAVDDFLFQSLREEPMTFLRFYQWEKPTASLGYSQNISRVLDVNICHEKGFDIVRRITGGKMVLHHQEITYCICSSDSEIFTANLTKSYRLISEALIKGLEKMGIEGRLAEETPSPYARGTLPCFSYPARSEIEFNGKKIIGSAQKRVGEKFIQHGSIPLEKDEEILRKISFLNKGKEMVRMVSLSEALGKKVDFSWAVDMFRSGISEYFNIHLSPRVISQQEKDTILKIQKKRYQNPEWTFRRKS
jgi:lipoate-protein ligase A